MNFKVKTTSYCFELPCFSLNLHWTASMLLRVEIFQFIYKYLNSVLLYSKHSICFRKFSYLILIML